MNIIDRRPNPTGRSLTNRQRFIARHRDAFRKAFLDTLKDRKIGDHGGQKVSVPASTDEPVFQQAHKGGLRDFVVPGNKKFVVGDKIDRPKGGGGSGRGNASPDSDGQQDAFEFVLTQAEYTELFFEDLELPDLIKTRLKESETTQLERAGFSVAGSPNRLHIGRTMLNAQGRRIAFHRPKLKEIAALEAQIELARTADDAEGEAQGLHDLASARRRSAKVGYIDPHDLRYKRFDARPKPNSQAVMFCLMDVSGSMTEAMKDLAKRFFMLLNEFLNRNYREVHVVFIRHHTNAQEVDEHTFFHSRETGGTIVSAALDEMKRIVRERYSPDIWNIYGAQASDGDNYTEDSRRCQQLLATDILPITQYFAYIETGAEATLKMGALSVTDLWRTYTEVAERHANFQMRRVTDPRQIFPVFHELFRHKPQKAAAYSSFAPTLR